MNSLLILSVWHKEDYCKSKNTCKVKSISLENSRRKCFRGFHSLAI